MIYPVENQRLLNYELRMLNEFDKAFITSPYDKAYLEHHLGHSVDRLLVVPNGVKEELLRRKENHGETNAVAFLGKMDYAPNVDAVKYFARAVFPMVREEVPDARFWIVGTSPTADVRRLGALDGIDVTGYVDDPYQYFATSKVVVAPLRFGAGIPNKVLEAMALGKAVVTTTKGARGIAGRNGEHFVVVDDPEVMANEIVDLLLGDVRRNRIGENARHLIEEMYRWDTISTTVRREVNDVLNRHANNTSAKN